jgi:putative addiction module component (TIGR02574 family)
VSVLELKEQVSRLSKAERLQDMECLWASLSEKPEEIESPEWHRRVLAARKAKVDSGEAQFLSVEQLKERLRRCKIYERQRTGPPSD